MRQVKRWRYYCDHCGKAGGSKYHILKHEKSCTLNPDRICKMCGYGEGNEPDLPRMIAIVSDNVRKGDGEYGGQTWSLKSGVSGDEIVSKLKEITTCPACILAAIRLSGVPAPILFEFDYKKESAEFWRDYNNAKAEEYDRY